MTVHLFGVLPAEADTFLATASTADCSWPACTNAAIIGALFKAPHSAVDTGMALSCACADHQPELEAETVDSWAPLTTATQTTV